MTEQQLIEKFVADAKSVTAAERQTVIANLNRYRPTGLTPRKMGPVVLTSELIDRVIADIRAIDAE